jgi:hypothetical protein
MGRIMSGIEASKFTAPFIPAFALIFSLYTEREGGCVQRGAGRRNVAAAFESQEFAALSKIIDPLFRGLSILGVESN